MWLDGCWRLQRLARDVVDAGRLREALERDGAAGGLRDVAAAVLRDEVLLVELHDRVAVVAPVVLARPGRVLAHDGLRLVEPRRGDRPADVLDPGGHPAAPRGEGAEVARQQ